MTGDNHVENGDSSICKPGAPRVTYVVLTHHAWPQVRRLIEAILRSSPTSRVLIAHDERQEAFPSTFPDERVHILKHGCKADWGSWELVDATLTALDFARRSHDPDLVCLVSGQDYPIRKLPEWERDAIAAPSWIGKVEPMFYTPRWGTRLGEGRDDMTRYLYRWFQTPVARMGVHARGRFGEFWRRLRDAIALRSEPVLALRVVNRGRGVYYGLRRRRVPFTEDRPCYFGSQWLALRRQELSWLLDEDLYPGSDLRRLYEKSIIPDESALVTPLCWRALPSSDMAPVTCVQWIPSLDRPKTYLIEDLPELIASGSPFCRKVDMIESAALMDALDNITRL